MKELDRDDLAPSASLRPCKLSPSPSPPFFFFFPTTILVEIIEIIDEVERTRGADQSDLVDGAPTAIQVVSRSFQDEELLAAGRVIDLCLRNANSLNH